MPFQRRRAGEFAIKTCAFPPFFRLPLLAPTKFVINLKMPLESSRSSVSHFTGRKEGHLASGMALISSGHLLPAWHFCPTVRAHKKAANQPTD